jgi:hypothetical protein
MSKKLTKPSRRGRRNAVFASLAAVAAMLVAGVGAAQAQADGVGSASARGTGVGAFVGSQSGVGGGTAQYSAVTNCDEIANTAPFIVQSNSVPSGGSVTFKRIITNASTCTTEGGSSVNKGQGFVNITGAFTGIGALNWEFRDSPDTVQIDITFGGGGLERFSLVSPQPQPLNGAPGGVWAFGNLPWPLP